MAVLWQAVKARRWVAFSGWREARRVQAAVLILILGLLGLSAINLDRTPPLWWDEGWTLSVARNWVDFGHYGRLLDGAPTNSTLSAALPVTAPVAVSFTLLGVGGWQGRLPGIVFLAGSLGLMAFLAWRLFNPRVALTLLVFLAVFFPHPDIHPAYLSRQVLGEPAMLFYLLGGYALCLIALKDRPWLVVLAALFWGLAIKAKIQVLPFWSVSLGLAIAYTVVRRHWRDAAWLSLAAVLAYGCAQLISVLQPVLLPGYVRSTTALEGLNDVTALVLDAGSRWTALRTTGLYGWPVLLGLAVCAWRWWQAAAQPGEARQPERTVTLMLLALAGSWAAWFALLSVGWPRYFYPPLFVGGLFLAAWWEAEGGSVSLAAVKARVALLWSPQAGWRRRLGVLGLLVVLGWTCALGVRTLLSFLSRPADSSVYAAADYINAQTRPGARVETYDSQLFFLLNRPYHYPPDQLHVEAIRRQFVDPTTLVIYDPMAADPDYLVVGPFSQWTGIYDAALATGAWSLVSQQGQYAIYARDR